jgi:hypothetical protein
MNNFLTASLLVGMIVGHFLFAYNEGNGYADAIERSWFQSFAIILVWFSHFLIKPYSSNDNDN